MQKTHTINGVNVHTQKALPKDYEKSGGGNSGGGGGGNIGGGNNRRNNNFSSEYLFYFKIFHLT